jgi:hypothetical protein
LNEYQHMKNFHCGVCGMMIFFENHRCLKCEHDLGFLPETLELAALEKTNDHQWRLASKSASEKRYRSCANNKQHGVCNWLVAADDPNPWCVACRLNEVVPDLTAPANLSRWSKLELAKRRCIYTFLNLALPVADSPGQTAHPLRFKFLEDRPNAPVRTGHENGVITINIAEADADERERRRLQMHEPYRTLVGHFRHESGHYYWDRLVANSPRQARFRELFGDENAPYEPALQTYYQQGPPADWAVNHVTSYAASHPWEDWAETWAHYLHIVDTLESAAGFRLSIMADAPNQAGIIRYDKKMNFDEMVSEWTPLTSALNAINRTMGLADLYPFAISTAVIEKLRFIHEIITGKEKK